MYKAVVIDDEMIHVSIIEHVIGLYAPLVDFIGFSHDLDGAYDLILSKKPDVVFLDVNLRKGNTFELLERLETVDFEIVFVTSDELSASKAFAFEAVDFVLKPASLERLKIALERVLNKLSLKRMVLPVKGSYRLTSNIEGGGFVPVASMDKIELLRCDEIMYCVADGKYTVFYMLNGGKHMSNKNIGDYERVFLETAVFYRVHHSYLVNMNHVVKIQKKDGGYCEMKNGVLIPISRRRQEEFNRLIRLDRLEIA